VSDDLDYNPSAAPPPGPPTQTPARRSSAGGAIGWVIAAAIVLVLAVAGGLLTAFIVANMRAVPGPIAGASLTPRPSFSGTAAPATAAPSASSEASEAPRRTPTPLPTAEVTPEPFVYIVQPGDHLINIADLYGVDIQDILDLNGLKNANRIFVGQQLLIPGYGTPPPTKKPKPPKN
jgi:LysM repeat protein